jgi:tripartite ATP-independent transporter DctP family solute receptor
MRLSSTLVRRALLPLASCVMTTGISAQTKLRMWNTHGEGYPVTVALKSFADKVRVATAGRWDVEVFSGGVLGDQPTAVKMVRQGEIDMAEFSSGALSDAVPGLKTMNLPFLFNDSAHMFSHLDGELGKRYAKRLEDAGYVLLGWYDGGARSFYCADRKLNDVKDLAQARIRVQSSEIYLEMVKNLEAQPAQIAFKDVLGAFESKKIDCAENNMPSYESTGHFRLAKSVLLTNHVISPEALVISSKTWSKLTEADKAIFKKEGAESAIYMRSLWQQRVKQAMEITEKQGSVFVRFKDSQRMIKRMTPLYQKYMNDPITREELLLILSKF